MKSTQVLAGRLAVVLILLTCSVWLWNRLPYPTDVEAPFLVTGSVGDTVTTPTIAVSISGAKVGSRLKLRNSIIKSNGAWVMIEGTVTAARHPGNAQAELVIGDRTYTPDNRSPVGTFSLPTAPLSPGIPQRGVWIFEVPTAVLESTASIPRLRVWVGMQSVVPRYFSRIPQIAVPLDDTHAQRGQVLIPPRIVMGQA